MLNARHSFALLWKRLMAALSLVMAATLAPTVAVPASGAGAVGSRVGSGATVTNAANALAAKVVAGLIEGGQHQPLDTATDDAHAKPCTLAAWQQLAPRQAVATSLPHSGASPPPTHAARAGPARAPPEA